LVFQNSQSNLEWLERKYRAMTIDFRDLPAYYHWMTDDARQEGLAKGREEGINEGLKRGREETLKEAHEKDLAALRKVIADMIQQSFPNISKFARKHLLLINQDDVLMGLAIKIHIAQDSDEATAYLLEALKKSAELD
jgi:flagellar biosynthesis/type III secretory pathway protein FliH